LSKRAIIKFGGADLADGKKIKTAAKMVSTSNYEEIVVVVSAIKGTTDKLVEITSECGKLSDENVAEIISMGERTSARIFTSALKALGVKALYLDPSSEGWPIITDSNFINAKPNMVRTCELVGDYIVPLLGENIVVVCGFLGLDEKGRVTTLGRGGSDTTAMILANCLKANEIILVKDTDGVMSADPKIVSNARPLRKLDIHEMFALSYGGAKVIKADSLKYKLPINRLRILNFVSGINSEGTEITGVFNSNSLEINKKNGLLAVSLVCKIEPLTVSKIISFFGNRPIYGISTGRASLTVFTSSEKSEELINILHNSHLCLAISSKSNVGLIELTHPIFVDSPGWVAKVSNVLASGKINIIEITTSTSTISVFIEESSINRASKILRDIYET
jgi:aspartate kinase